MFRRNLGTGGQLLTWVWRRPDPRAALARRPVRHLRLDGAPLAAAPAVHPGALGRLGGPDRVVRVRDAADARHARLLRDRDRDRALARVRRPSTTGPAGRGSASRSATSISTGRGGRCGRAGSSSSSPTAGTGAIRPSSPPRRRGFGGTAIASSGSTRWPGRLATSHSRAGCGPPSRTLTTSCPPARLPALSGSARSSAGVRAGDTRRGSEAAAHAALAPS